MRWLRLFVALATPTIILANAANYSLFSSSFDLGIPRKPSDPECFNCQLSKFTCGQFGDCSPYDGQCKCPDGWGGIDCLQPQCGSLKYGKNRPLRPDGVDCQCSEGWTGLNCNVCKNDGACDGFPIGNGLSRPMRQTDGSLSPSLKRDEGRNMTCYRNGPTVMNNHYMCNVTNRKILDILKGAKPQVTFNCDKATASCRFQFWIGSKESFYCAMDECESDLVVGPKYNTTKYDCQKIKCNCIPGRILCDASIGIDLSDWLPAEIKGPGKFQCKTGGGGCTFEEPAMNGLITLVFSDPWITLNCEGGECLHYSQVPGFVQPDRGFGSLWVSVGTASGIFISAVLLLWYLARPIKDHGIQLPTTQSLVDNHIPATLQFEDVSYELPQHSFRILDNVSGSVQPGQLLAIMGASGAGKSTLLDILAQRQKRGVVSGTILVNGRPVSASVFRRATGYVDQEETLMSTLTVCETVYYSALLRLPREMSAHAKHIRTLETLDELGILDIRDQPIGDSLKGHRGISGGEKRRVSIACELVTSPSIIFLDEPTSGLDAHSALSVVEALHRLAREYNRTVIFTIHQPRSNIVALFDRLILLAKGRVVYSGEMAVCQQYFAEVGFPCPTGFNIADYLIDTTTERDDVPIGADDLGSAQLQDARRPAELSSLRTLFHHLTGHTSRSALARTSISSLSARPTGARIAALASAYARSTMATSARLDVSSTALGTSDNPEPMLLGRRRATWVTQFRILSGRAFKNLYRDPALLATQYLSAILIAVAAGYFYYHVGNDIEGFQNRLGFFFFTMALFAFSCLSSISVFSKERTLFMRERANGYYSTFTFFSAKILFDIVPLRAIPPLVFGSIVYGLVGLVPTAIAFWKFQLVLVLFNLTSASLCLLLAVACEDVGVANLFGTLIMLFNLLFAGLFLNRRSVAPWLLWLFTISFFHASYEALSVNELRYLSVQEEEAGFKFDVPAAVVLLKFGLRAQWYWTDVGLLAGIFSTFTAASFVWLHFFVKESR